MKEGRGQGSDRDYKPWIEVSDFSSSGRVSRDLGWKTDRVHYLMSDGETRLYYLFEWSDRILDIREQSPLIDRELCFKIAEDMGRDTAWEIISPIVDREPLIYDRYQRGSLIEHAVENYAAQEGNDRPRIASIYRAC